MRQVLLGAGIVGLVLVAVAGTALGGWTREHVPPRQGELTSVSCSAARTCMAVGLTFTGPRGGDLTFAERSRAGRWRVQRSPNPSGAHENSLVAVSCAAADACMAVGEAENSNVGHFVPLAERWNGHHWSITRVPHRNNWYLYGVSCPSSNDCIAVGLKTVPHGTLTLVERWGGHRWSVQKTPDLAGAKANWLYGVSCPSASACTAVGFSDLNGQDHDVPLAERWNGHRWSVQTVPDPAGSNVSQLQAVSCPSATACTAVGVQTAPKPSPHGTGLAERWNGQRWTIEPSPDPTGGQSSNPTGTILYGVSCPSAKMCIAVGQGGTGFEKGVALAERWDGHRWSLEKTHQPTGKPSTLGGVSCVSRRACIAAGSYGFPHGPYTPLIERYG